LADLVVWLGVAGAETGAGLDTGTGLVTGAGLWPELSVAPDEPDVGEGGVTVVLVCVLCVVLPSTVLELEVVIRVVVVPSVDVTLCTVTRPCDDEEWEG
jgi:hypothetical protein